MNKQKNNFIMKIALFLVVIGIVIVAIYYSFIRVAGDKASEESYPSTTYEILVARDLEASYPATTSEVVKLYNKYLKYIYNSETTEEEFSKLVDQIRLMWSEDWLSLNERSAHIHDFQQEVARFREEGLVMSNYTVNESTTAKGFTTPEGVDGKTIISSYLYSKKKSMSKVYMKFYLLSEAGNWKILYYELVDEYGNLLETENQTDES